MIGNFEGKTRAEAETGFGEDGQKGWIMERRMSMLILHDERDENRAMDSVAARERILRRPGRPDQETDGAAVDAKPIAIYTERLLEVQREFALYDDRVVVQARWRLKGRFTHVVKLAMLKGEIQELTIRYRVYRYAGWVLTAGGLAFALSYYYAEGGARGMLEYTAMGVMILGATVRALTYRNRRVRFARFDSKSGQAGLDIGCAGNDPAAFDAFVKQVRRQIAKA